MKFRPSAKLQRNEIAVRRVISPIDGVYWDVPKVRELIIHELIVTLEAEAFMRDYVILGPAHLTSAPFAGIPTYLVQLSAPMIRAEDWELANGIVRKIVD